MKNIIILSISLLISISSFAQQGINYKAVIKDDLGNIMANQNMKVRFIIEEADGSNEYVEVHEVTTDANGLIILNIGEGTPGQFNDFNEIDWAAENYYLQVGIDPELDGSYITFDATAFKTVPYALQSEKANYALSAGSATFKTEDNVTSNSPGDMATDDFVFGSTQLDATSNVTESNRLFFNKGKGAFRAGTSGNNEWDDTNLGIGSFASGENTTASALTSTAMGYNTTASQIDATALGTGTTASGISSLSAGSSTKAEAYASTAIGRFNAGGGNPTSWQFDDPIFEIGIGSSNIPGNRYNALTVYKNGNASIFGNLTVGRELTVGKWLGDVNPGAITYDSDDFTFYGFTEQGVVTLGSKWPKSIVIPSAAFNLCIINDDSIDKTSVIYTALSVRFRSYYSSLITGPVTFYLVAPISLPAYSRITKITYVFNDNETEANYNIKIIRDCSLTNESPVIVTNDLYEVNAPDYTLKTNAAIDELMLPNCQYIMTIEIPFNSIPAPGQSERLKFYRAIINYIEE
jgi:hypothetical protein